MELNKNIELKKEAGRWLRNANFILRLPSCRSRGTKMPPRGGRKRYMKTIHRYVRIRGADHPLSDELLQGSKIKLIEHCEERFPDNKKLNFCIDFIYSQ